MIWPLYNVFHQFVDLASVEFYIGSSVMSTLVHDLIYHPKPEGLYGFHKNFFNPMQLN